MTETELRAFHTLAARAYAGELIDLDTWRQIRKLVLVPAREQSTIFATHRCWKCSNGTLACVAGHPHNCEYPHAKND
jgi:hypothetical protein